MKYVVNKCFGGFRVKEDVLKALGYGDDWGVKRDDPRLVDMVEKLGSEAVSGSLSYLEVVEIPDEATDWELSEYDGVESITAVVDGKLVHIY